MKNKKKFIFFVLLFFHLWIHEDISARMKPCKTSNSQSPTTKRTKKESSIVSGIATTIGIVTSLPTTTIETTANISSECSMFPDNFDLRSSNQEKMLHYLAYNRQLIMEQSAQGNGEFFQAYFEFFGCNDLENFASTIAENFDYVFSNSFLNLAFINQTEDVIKKSDLSCKNIRSGQPQFLKYYIKFVPEDFILLKN